MKKAFPWLRKKADPQAQGKVVVKGKRVVLREKRLEDARDDLAWRTDDELARLDATRPLDMSYDAFLRYSRDELTYDNPISKRLAIDTLDGRHIGNCMFYDIDQKRSQAELGIMIGDRNYWSRGFGTDAIDAFLRHIFTTTSLNRVYLHTLDWNDRAKRSFAKSGFREVKNVHRSGMDFVLMEVLRPDWDLRSGLSPDGASSQHESSQDGHGAPTDGPSPAAAGQ